MQFQNAQYTPKNPGKFEKLLAAEQSFYTNPDCKPQEIIGGCSAFSAYQAEKSKDVTGDLTIVYSTDPKLNEIIQTQKYLDWIKTNYGTALTFKLDEALVAK